MQRLTVIIKKRLIEHRVKQELLVWRVKIVNKCKNVVIVCLLDKVSLCPLDALKLAILLDVLKLIFLLLAAFRLQSKFSADGSIA